MWLSSTNVFLVHPSYKWDKYLVSGLEHLDYFSHHIGNVIIPTDELHHFSEG
jgi:hypothetical protein